MMKRIGFGFLLLLLLATAVPLAAAKSLLAVELVYFQGSGELNGVHLSWETGTELDTAAFIIRRDNGSGFIDLAELYDENGNLYPGGVIAGQGNGVVGEEYLAIDRTAVFGTNYRYQLIEIEVDNSISVLATINVMAGATPTPTPILINQSSPTASATPGQNTATSTAIPTATTINNNQPGASSTPPLLTTTSGQDNSGETSATGVTDNNAVASAGDQPVTANPANSETQQLLAQTEPTADTDYPAEKPTPLPTTPEDSYPAQVPLPENLTATSYPVNNSLQPTDPTPTIIAVIGAQPTDESESALNSAIRPTQPSSVRSISVLWGSFFLAMIIFIATIVGSIMIFVRKRE